MLARKCSYRLSKRKVKAKSNESFIQQDVREYRPAGHKLAWCSFGKETLRGPSHARTTNKQDRAEQSQKCTVEVRCIDLNLLI